MPVDIPRATTTTRSRFYGKYRGVVTSNTDPLRRGRIQAEVPAVLADVPTGWALPCVPYAGAGSGAFTVPPVGAGVWIEFEGGDPDYPVWSGCWWGDGQAPADTNGVSGLPGLKILRSEQGLMLALDDDGQTVTLSDASGANLLTISVLQGQVRIQAAATAVVEAPRIALVDGSTHPLVFGDQLLAYLSQLVTTFNTHLHPGETAAGVLPVTPAPPAPPATPPTPALLSTRVTTG